MARRWMSVLGMLAGVGGLATAGLSGCEGEVETQPTYPAYGNGYGYACAPGDEECQEEQEQQVRGYQPYGYPPQQAACPYGYAYYVDQWGNAHCVRQYR